MHIPKNTVLMFSSLAALMCAIDVARAQAVADDFKIIATFGPGYSNSWPWKCTIDSNGRVLQEMKKPLKKDAEPHSKEFSLTKEDLKFLADKIKEADFFKLKNEYRPKAFDLQTLTLEITMNKQSQRVRVFAHQVIADKKEQEEADRFLSVWKALLTKVPSPNNDNLEKLKAGILIKEKKTEKK